METYKQIKARHSEEQNQFPMQFAFSQEQFQKALQKLGAVQSDCMTVGAGSVLRKADYPALKTMHNRHESEMKQFLESDKNLISAIAYELANHEFCISYDANEVIDCLGLDMSDARTIYCFQEAKELYF